MSAPMRTKRPDPALEWLAGESQYFAKQHAEAATALGDLREKYEREISSLPEVKIHLDKLKARGVKPERVLKYLVAFVLLEKHAEWQPKLVANNANLRKLAGRL